MSGKTIAITGASRGLGAGLAEYYRAQGHRLALCARTMEETKSETEIHRSVDVTDRAALEAFADEATAHLGAIDCWINNAGVLDPIQPLREADPLHWWKLMEINVKGTALASRWYANHVRSGDGGGVLINISSGAAQHGYAGWTAYCASKAAVDLMSEALALEESDAGLRVHAVAPGVIDTDMQTMIRESTEHDFPEVDKFVELKEHEAFNSPEYVARELEQIAFASQPDSVVLRLAAEN